MFTGLVEQVGTIEQLRETAAGRELRVRCAYDDLQPGESIAVNGACLTVREHGAGWFTVAAVVTTLDRTTIGEWVVGRDLNLERAMLAGSRFGGHIVLGHVDGVGTVTGVARQGDATLVDVLLPDEVTDLLIPHGSITIDGVSLTVNEIPAPDVVQLSLIEYTLAHTTLGRLEVGAHVQVEGDVIGKYARRMLAPYQASYHGSPSMNTQE